MFYFITTNLAGGFDTFADVDIVDVKVDGVMIEGCLGAVVWVVVDLTKEGFDVVVGVKEEVGTFEAELEFVAPLLTI